MSCTESQAAKILAKKRWANKSRKSEKPKTQQDKIQAILNQYPYDYELEEYVKLKKSKQDIETKNKIKRLEAQLYQSRKLKKPYQQLKRLIKAA